MNLRSVPLSEVSEVECFFAVINSLIVGVVSSRQLLVIAGRSAI